MVGFTCSSKYLQDFIRASHLSTIPWRMTKFVVFRTLPKACVTSIWVVHIYKFVDDKVRGFPNTSQSHPYWRDTGFDTCVLRHIYRTSIWAALIEFVGFQTFTRGSKAAHVDVTQDLILASCVTSIAHQYGQLWYSSWVSKHLQEASYVSTIGWLRWVGSLKLWVSFAEYRLFYRALLQTRPRLLRSLLFVATPYELYHPSRKVFCNSLVHSQTHNWQWSWRQFRTPSVCRVWLY